VRPADPRYQIGAGKVEELAALIQETSAEKVIFDNPLKPVQSYNLAKATHTEAIDRFQLILEIFTRRASTTEAQLQIQLARLQYDLTQAKERVRLAKRGEQPGFMGLGAYEADVYFEAVKRQMHTTRRKIKRIREKRVLQRERRTELGFMSIALAGYTGAGKSSLFNALTESKVDVSARATTLFTTLSTTTRLIEISKKRFLLTDTVGFIDRLPLMLIEAFHSTLEETIYSDLIVLLLDASEPLSTIENKLEICLETIDRIGASGIPIVTALNKNDLITPDQAKSLTAALKDKAPNPVQVSALLRTNLEELKQAVLRILSNYIKLELTIPQSDEAMPLISWLYNASDVLSIEYTPEFAHIVFESTPSFADKVRSRVEAFNGKIVRI
jgi:GTP-binding protein HflX